MEPDQSQHSDGENETSGPVVSIDLFPVGDAGSAFRTQNDPSNPYQRNNVIERKGAVDIRCSCVDVIHGLFDSESDTYCTLLVLQFRFDPRKRARRISSVDVELRFASSEPGEVDPEVYDIAPNKRLSLSPTTQSETTTQGGELTLSAEPVAGVGAGAGMNWSRSVSRETSQATTVTGSIDMRGRNFGRANCASWTLLENEETKTGVPVSMTTAVLLKRKTEARFECAFSLKAKAEWRTTLESLFGSTPRDDPVLFDPTLDPTSDRYDELNLGKIDLASISDITFMNMQEGVVKTFGQKGSAS